MFGIMQSNQNGSIADNEQLLAEWPTLSDVCSNVKQISQNGGSSRQVKKDQRRTNSPTDGAEGDDSAKENEDSSSQTNGRGARKKGSRQKWVPVPIVPQPYRKRFERGNGRPSFDSYRGGSNSINDKKNESYDYTNGTGNYRGGARGSNRSRGKRGRGVQHNWRQRSEETSRGEIGNHPSDAEYLTNGMFYDPFALKCFSDLARENELKKAIRNQIEYYFCEQNLETDFFMRRRMDSQGYVPLTLVAGFNRVMGLTQDFAKIVEAVSDSDKLEILDGIKVRPVVDPLKWPIMDGSQIAGLRTDVPEFVPGQPYISYVVKGMERISVSPDSNSDQHISNGMESADYYSDDSTEIASPEPSS